MQAYSLHELQKALACNVYGNATPTILDIATDSRLITNGEHLLFFALKGIHHNAHDYVEDLYHTHGVRCFVISELRDSYKLLTDAVFLHVTDTLEALQRLATYHSQQFAIPVVAITGSNGKTIVKEWLSQVLTTIMHVHHSPKSYNSQVGVPLAVLGLNSDAEIAIYEAGISQMGEMQHLQQILHPTLGIFTNIGHAHQAGFPDMETKAREKMQLFVHAQQLIICRDQELVYSLAQELERKHGVELVSWSLTGQKADWNIDTDATPTSGHLAFTLRSPHSTQQYRGSLQSSDAATTENAFHTLIASITIGLTPQEAITALEKLEPIPMRLERREGINGNALINDSYSCDLESLDVALAFLAQQAPNSRKGLILSDIDQSGLPPEVLYARVASRAAQYGVDLLAGIGEDIASQKALFPKAHFYNTTEEYLHGALQYPDYAILVKGGRRFRFERITQQLERRIHKTVMEVNLNALENNLNVFRARLQKGVKLLVLVKAFAYGNGLDELAQFLQYHQVDYLGVAFADEGYALRTAGIQLPILVLNPAPDALPAMIANKLEPNIFSLDLLHSFAQAVKDAHTTLYPIHIKLDTGMHRVGFMEHEIPALLEECATVAPYLRIASIFSHLAAADDPQYDNFTQQQLESFERMSQAIIAALPYQPLRHILNSAGQERFATWQYDMVRLGIGLHGISSRCTSTLQPVASLKTFIAQIKQIPAGETVGYARKGTVAQEKTIATIPIGYADGYYRRLGNGIGHVAVHGTLAPTIGNICMDTCMIDISGIDAQVGDTVTIFGDKPTLDDVAQWADTIPYEILSSVSPRIPRTYYTE